MQVIQSICLFVFHQQTPSHLAAKKGRFENTLKDLVDKRADINIKDNNGVSSYYIAQQPDYAFHIYLKYT